MLLVSHTRARPSFHSPFNRIILLPVSFALLQFKSIPQYFLTSFMKVCFFSFFTVIRIESRPSPTFTEGVKVGTRRRNSKSRSSYVTFLSNGCSISIADPYFKVHYCKNDCYKNNRLYDCRPIREQKTRKNVAVFSPHTRAGSFRKTL